MPLNDVVGQISQKRRVLKLKDDSQNISHIISAETSEII